MLIALGILAWLACGYGALKLLARLTGDSIPTIMVPFWPLALLVLLCLSLLTWEIKP